MKKIDEIVAKGKALSDKLPDWKMPTRKKKVHRRDNYEEYRCLYKSTNPWSK